MPPSPRRAIRSSRSYGGVPAEVRVARRRDRFLDAGLEMFGTGGYRTTSVRAICREAGLSERYFYESFASTEELLVGVYRRCTDSMHDEILVALAGVGLSGAGRSGSTGSAGSTGQAGQADDGIGRLVRSTLEAFFDSVRDPRVLRVCWLEVLGVGPVVDATYIAGIDRFAELVASVLAGAVGRDVDEHIRLVGTALVGAVMTTAVRWYLDGQSEPVSALVEANAMLFTGVARELDAGL